MPDSAASFRLPDGYDRVRVVDSFAALVETPWGDGVNALCWRRELPGDFEAVVAACGPFDEITSLDEEVLAELELGPAGQAARAVLIADLARLRERGLAPSLDLIPAYPRDEDGGPVPTDVYSFHADSAPVLADTYLCSYTVAASEGLRNEEARRKVDVPEIRAELRRNFGAGEEEAFRTFLSGHCYDLHYAPTAGARPFSFGLGNLWRIANQCPGSPVPPCVHRAPETRPGQAPRLLLIS